MKEKTHGSTQFFAELDAQAARYHAILPQKTVVNNFVDEMFALLFPINKHQMGSAELSCDNLMKRLAFLVQPLTADSTNIVELFLTKLPELHKQMRADAEAVLALDPAAQSQAEVIAAYPGFYATAVYRMANQLDSLGIPLLPRMFTEYAHSKTGIDIHPSAQIGPSFVIDHGTGVVIGATARIGRHVTLYHGVTLGALHVKKSEADLKRHPTIEDHVTIYANATVLGGTTVIGHHSVIGGNVWITRSQPPHSRIYYQGVSAEQRRSHSTQQKQLATRTAKPTLFTGRFSLSQQSIANALLQRWQFLRQRIYPQPAENPHDCVQF